MDHLRRSLNSIFIGILLCVFGGLPNYAAENIKTVSGVAKANLKSFNGVLEANIKTIQAVDNTAAGGGGTPAFVEVQNATPSSSASTLDFTITVAANATVVCATGWEDAARTVTCSSSIDGAFTALTAHSQASEMYGRMFYKTGLTAGTHTITFSYGATTAFVKGAGIELSGVTSIDAEATPGATGLGSSSPATTGNVTTVNNVEALVCFTMNYVAATSTPQTNWTEDYDIGGFSAQHRITSATGTYNGSTTTSADGSTVIFMAAFK